MSYPHAPADARLVQLEYRLSELHRQLGVDPVRPALWQPRRQIWPAITAAEPGQSYNPAAPWLKFLEPDLTTKRQNDARSRVYHIRGESLPVDTKIEVFPYGGKWLTDATLTTSSYRAKVGVNMLTTTGNVKRWIGGAYESTGVDASLMAGGQPVFLDEVVEIKWFPEDGLYYITQVPVRTHKIQTQASISKSGSGNVRRYNSGNVLVAYDFAANSPLGAVGNAKLGHIGWTGSGWDIISTEC